MTQIFVTNASNSAKFRSFRRLLGVFGTLALAASFSLTTVGCSKKKAEDESTTPNSASSGAGTTAGAASNDMTGDSDTNKAGGLKTVNFAYDSFALTNEGKETLKSNSDILKTNSTMKIQVEGHCDARGGIQYNIALGEKRANATKKFLEDLGVQAERITTISFGKERLLDQGTTEEAHAKNRRANFVITSK